MNIGHTIRTNASNVLVDRFGGPFWWTVLVDRSLVHPGLAPPHARLARKASRATSVFLRDVFAVVEAVPAVHLGVVESCARLPLSPRLVSKRSQEACSDAR